MHSSLTGPNLFNLSIALTGHHEITIHEHQDPSLHLLGMQAMSRVTRRLAARARLVHVTAVQVQSEWLAMLRSVFLSLRSAISDLRSPISSFLCTRILSEGRKRERERQI